MTSTMPRIPFSLEDRLAQMVRHWHRALWEGMLDDAKAAAGEFGYHVERSTLVADADPMALIRRLADLIGRRGVKASEARVRLNAQLVAAERGWFRRFSKVGDTRTKERIFGFTLPSAQIFQDRIGELRELYLNQAVERALGEQDDLKASFLLRLSDWAEGRAEKLDVDGLVQQMQETSARRAKFFARDQYSRFERSLALASIRHAEAPYVEVLTANDARVRPTHREWNHSVFTPDALLSDPRWDDYNCRCAFVARWELTAQQQGRFVA